jgi:hypothetical protein
MWELINETGRFPVATDDLVGMTLGRLVKRLPGEGYKLVSMLAFAPARDDWNVASDETHENDVSGQESAYYCQLTYAVVDAEGLASDDAVLGTDPKTITIQVRQQNDQPTDTVLQDRAQSSTLIGYEDNDLIIKFAASDVEDDDFVFSVVACNNARGQFYYPARNQHDFILPNGELDLSKPETSLFDTRGDPIACEDAVISNPEMLFSDTNGKGWFVLFRPNENDSGQDFSFIRVSYNDGTVIGQAEQLSDRTIHIRPVNDAPEIFSGGAPASDITNKLVIQSSTPLGLALSFADADDTTVFDGVGFQVRVKSAELRPNQNIDMEDAFTYVVAPAANSLTIQNKLIVPPNNNGELGKMRWIASIAQGNAFAAQTSINFVALGEYVLEIVVSDAGMSGYCSPDVVEDLTVYPIDDVRTAVGHEGKLVGSTGYEESRCVRVSVVELRIQVNVASSVIGGIASGAGAGLLALLALGAVVFAKMNKPEDLDAWQALDNAQITNAQTSGIHKSAKNGGTSALYEGK